MRLLFGTVITILCLILAGSRDKLPSNKTPITKRNPATSKYLTKANAFFEELRYREALAEYENGLHSTAENDASARSSFLLGIANCHLNLRDFTRALEAYTQTLNLAQRHGLKDVLFRAGLNRASLYLRMDDAASAMQAMQQFERIVYDSNEALAFVAVANAVRDLDPSRAEKLYARALQLADGNLAEQGTAWSNLGHTYLLQGKLPQADQALTEAFRLRVLTRKPLQTLYYYLGRLRRLQGSADAAVTLLGRAKDVAQLPGNPIALSAVQHELALAYLSRGDDQRALAEFGEAVQNAHRWRANVLQSETFRVSTETTLQKLFSDYIRAGMKYFERTGDERVAKKMFEVAEDSRTTLFEQSLLRQRNLPPAYWELLARYRQLLKHALETPNALENPELGSLRLQLSDLEATIGLKSERSENSHQISEKDASSGTLGGLQKKLRDTEALLSFYSSPDDSYVWALTRKRFEVRRLPPGATLRQKIQEFRNTLLENETRSAQSDLSQDLLGGLSAEITDKSEWILSLDGPLFELPFAALRVPGQRNKYLGTRYALRITPGALIDAADAEFRRDKFAGIADAIYNGADPRRRSGSASGPLQLARLPGSLREINRCVRAWGRDTQPEIATGGQVNRDTVLRLMSSGPAVLHLAAHVLPHPKIADQVMIALGVQPSGEAEYLAPADIAPRQIEVGLVTLSGCGSASGKALPGVGLFGLTRAWLTAGAASVVATQWPITDDGGELLSTMYRELGSNGGPLNASAVARALRTAQMQMLEAGGWRAKPEYWAAFMVVGKD